MPQEDAALGSRRGDELPEELQRREDRLAVIEAAKERLEAQARADGGGRDGSGVRRPRPSGSGRARSGGARSPGRSASPTDKAQTNFTDPELKIMKQSNKGWDYCGNAQASVDGTCQIIVAC